VTSNPSDKEKRRPMKAHLPTAASRRLPSLVLGVVFAAGCGGPPDAPRGGGPELANTDQAAALAPFRTRTSEIMTRLEDARQMTAFMRMGDAAAEFTAWISEGDEPILIQETVGMGDYGNGRARYVFSDGGLLYYESQFTTLFVTDPNRARRKLVDIQMGFEPPAMLRGAPTAEEAGPGRATSAASRLPPFRGRVVVNKTVDGRAVPLEEHEIPGIRARALLLADSILARIPVAGG
jgi:hypothetical protein